MKATRVFAAGALLCVSLAALVILLSVMATGTTAAAPAPAQVRADPGDVLINEVIAKGTEYIELFNPTGDAIVLDGWSLDDGEGTDGLAGSIPAGGYLVTPTANIALSNDGDDLTLYDDLANVIDTVAFGIAGGAPLAHTDMSTARTPNGQDTDNDAQDWTIDPTPTLGAENDAAGVSLGSSLLINEVNNYSPPADDAIEFFNPLDVSVPITGWMISDGDGLATINVTAEVPAGGWLVVNPNDFGIFPSSSDVLYLFDSEGVRVDQIGWEGEFEDDTFQRIPDGTGPNDGYNWVSSGGGVTWFDVPETLGGSNSFFRTILLDKDAPVQVNVESLITYTLQITNQVGLVLDQVTVTDVVPENTEFAYALDGGGESEGTVTWVFSDVEHLTGVTARFVVTAPNVFTTVINADYAVSASNFVTPTVGDPVTTIVYVERLAIHDIQGAAHLSPLEGLAVADIEGIVTAVRYNAFYMQDPLADNDPATSEAIYVYTGGSPGVAVGDAVLVSGDVAEYFPGGSSSGNLPTTELENAMIEVVSSGNPLPDATIVGEGGRIPPSQIIDNDSSGDVTTGIFDPDEDGIDFYESMEAMLLQINDALVVGPTNFYGEIPVVSDNGANAGLLTPRGGLVARADDFNPERIILDDGIVSGEPKLPVSSLFTAPITGVLDYSFGNFKLLNVNPLPPAVGSLISETAPGPVANELRVASFNLLNLDPGDGARFGGLANQIVHHLLSPDIIGVQEVQDNNGETDDGTVDASETFTTLIGAIESAGGPTYDFRQINPLDNQDGGAPGSNIRVGFLFRTDRGLEFVDRPGGDATTPVSVTMGITGVELSISPGRINPESPAWDESRKPLAGEFMWHDRKLFVVVAHFNSKGGDNPLFGWNQPPILSSEEQRILQAQEVNDFVDAVLALDADANVMILGDLNDFQFSTPISDVLAADVLINLMTTLPITEQYTYLYDGNSQVLDHILVSNSLFDSANIVFDAVHVNAEFAATDDRPSDHDPVVAVITFGQEIYFPLINKNS